MAKETVQLYLASASVAERTGFRTQRYVTKDGKYIVNDRDLRNVRLTPDEYKDGLDVTPISTEEARKLEAENGYKMGHAVSNEQKEKEE